ncbi:MAG: hypothetical protein P8Z30_15100 [Acidobacteriota bacterium]
MFSVTAKRLKHHCMVPLLISMLFGAAVACAGAQEQEPTTTASAPAIQEEVTGFQTAPVVVDGTTLFYVRGVSAYPARKRAQDIA